MPPDIVNKANSKMMNGKYSNNAVCSNLSAVNIKPETKNRGSKNDNVKAKTFFKTLSNLVGGLYNGPSVLRPDQFA